MSEVTQLLECDTCGTRLLADSRFAKSQDEHDRACNGIWQNADRNRLTFSRLRQQNVSRCVEQYHPIEDYSLNDWLACVSEEFGEVARLCKRLRSGELSEDENRTKLGHEIADTITYLDLLAARAGIDLERATVEKFNIVSQRTGSRRTL